MGAGRIFILRRCPHGAETGLSPTFSVRVTPAHERFQGGPLNCLALSDGGDIMILSEFLAGYPPLFLTQEERAKANQTGGWNGKTFSFVLGFFRLDAAHHDRLRL
jgi:hypothetical protein